MIRCNTAWYRCHKPDDCAWYHFSYVSAGNIIMEGTQI